MSYNKTIIMIEPFEYEPKKIKAPKPHGVVASQELGPIDRNQTFSKLVEPMESMKLDSRQSRVFQTKIGNPSLESSHDADLVPDRIIGKGPLVVSEQAPREASVDNRTTSEILASVIDREAIYVPPLNRHHMPPFTVNSLDSPFLEPGLTNVYARKYTPNWA